jgi:hypothetical protein
MARVTGKGLSTKENRYSSHTSAREPLYEASIALLKITGMYGGVVNALSETDPEKIIRKQAEAQVQREGIPRDATHDALVRLTESTRYHERLQEIEAKLRREYGEDCEGK